MRLLAMNRTIGVAALISGIFFGLCGLIHFLGANTASWHEAFDVDTVLFLGGGCMLLLGGILLYLDVHLAAPGSLMVRRGTSS